MTKVQEFNLALKDFNEQAKSISIKKVFLFPIVIAFPIICAIVVGWFSKQLKHGFISFAMASLLSGLFYRFYIGGKYLKLKGEFKQFLLRKYMQEYYPEIDYVYKSGASKGNSYLSHSTLVHEVSEFAEEDVIEGRYDECDFYLSQIYRTEEGHSDLPKIMDKCFNKGNKFRGILIELRSPRFNFPETTIRSVAGLLRRTFEGYKFHDKFQFAYSTNDEDKLAEATAEILPFIAYLKAKHEDVKILLNGNRILMMLSTKMDFLDEPNFRLGDDFTDEKYYHGMSQHLNSMFFILESLIGNESPLELEQKLVLRVKRKLLD